VHIWNYATIATQQLPIVLNDFNAWVMAVCFSNDSKRVIASGADNNVRIRDVDSAELYAQLAHKAKRNLTVEEWNKYIGKDIPYEKTKPE
jgi:WD40 repeat protein